MKTALSLVAMLLSFSSFSQTDLPKMKNYLNHADYPDQFWQTDTPSSVGLDEQRLNQALKHIQQNQLEIHSFSIIKNGKLVFDHYGHEKQGTTQKQRTPLDPHEMHSTTKMITSALVGIAMEEGLIEGLKSPALNYLPFSPSGPDKKAITIEDVLTMRTGFQYQEGVDDDPIFFSPDNSAQAIFARPIAHPPGTSWNYSSADSQILSEILRNVTQKTPAEYAQQKLFSPLGIGQPKWIADKSGTHYGGWGLFLTPRDLARIGYLYLQKGRWGKQQLIPKQWIHASAQARTDTYWSNEYGYHMWIPKLGGYSTSGYLGQNMYMLPEQNIIVVFTAALPADQADSILAEIVKTFLI